MKTTGAIKLQVPFLDLARAHLEIADEIDLTIQRVIAGGSFILGTEVADLEREWARYCGTRGAVGVASGTDALTLALLATINNGDEVITSTLSAGYTALAIANAGGVPVFADIDESTFNICPVSAASLITPRTRAIVPVHLYGQMADMEAICAIAADHGLCIIEDAAQAHGATLDGKRAGSFGRAAAYSFFPTKNLGAYGDGGAVVSNDQDLLDNVITLRQGGHLQNLQKLPVGRNSRLDEIQAAILRVKLKKLDEWNSRRTQIAVRYDSAFRGIVQTPVYEGSGLHVYHLYVIRHSTRDALKTYLAARGVETLIHYPFLLHRQQAFRQPSQPPLPNAEKIAGEILSLPLNPYMTETEIEMVIETVLSFGGRT